MNISNQALWGNIVNEWVKTIDALESANNYFEFGKDSLKDITMILKDPKYNYTPNHLVCDIDGFRITEELNPAGYDALYHGVQYLGSGNVHIRGDNTGYTFCSDYTTGTSQMGWGRPGIYNGPLRSKNDKLIGGSGNNYLEGFDGNDTLIGNGKNNILTSESGDSYLQAGNNGMNYLQVGSGNNTLVGGAAQNYMYAGSGNDTLIGGTGDNILQGDSGNAKIIAGSGDNILIGGSGRDTLDGSKGKNNIFVGNAAGVTLMIGGDGNDTFVFQKNTGGVNFIEEKGNGHNMCLFSKNIGIGDIIFQKSGDNLLVTESNFTDSSTIMQFTDWFNTFSVQEFFFAGINQSFEASDVAQLFPPSSTQEQISLAA